MRIFTYLQDIRFAHLIRVSTKCTPCIRYDHIQEACEAFFLLLLRKYDGKSNTTFHHLLLPPRLSWNQLVLSCSRLYRLFVWLFARLSLLSFGKYCTSVQNIDQAILRKYKVLLFDDFRFFNTFFFFWIEIKRHTCSLLSTHAKSINQSQSPILTRRIQSKSWIFNTSLKNLKFEMKLSEISSQWTHQSFNYCLLISFFQFLFLLTYSLLVNKFIHSFFFQTLTLSSSEELSQINLIKSFVSFLRCWKI